MIQEQFDESQGGVLISRIIIDDDGNVIEQWPQLTD
jgi:hypothetical protein